MRPRTPLRQPTAAPAITEIIRLSADAPLEARHAQQAAQRLHYHTQGRTNKENAHAADITETAPSEPMRGRTWGTLPVPIRLEHALGSDLWCGKHHTNGR